MWSHDDGLTWGAASPVAYPPQVNVGSLIGPAVGLQATDGTLAFWVTSGFLAVSQDHGTSFQASQHVRGEPSSECSIAFAADPSNSTLIMNCRSGKDHRRAQLYWHRLSNGTYTSTEPTYPPQLTDPGCQGSILNAGNGTLYTSNAGSTSARERMTIHRSDDHGRSWSAGLVLHAGPSAYSQLVRLQGDSSTGAMGVLFEAGVHGAYETISFAPFVWAPPQPRPSQQWTLRADGTLSTDGKRCLDWTLHGDNAYVSPCDPANYPHQVWKFTNGGHLVSGGSGSLVLDWTSRIGADGGHSVYMHEASASLPHQRWAFSGKTLSSSDGDGLCLDWLADGNAILGNPAVEMRPCAATVLPPE